jgi:hypothetical protein
LVGRRNFLLPTKCRIRICGRGEQRLPVETMASVDTLIGASGRNRLSDGEQGQSWVLIGRKASE